MAHRLILIHASEECADDILQALEDAETDGVITEAFDTRTIDTDTERYIYGKPYNFRDSEQVAALCEIVEEMRLRQAPGDLSMVAFALLNELQTFTVQSVTG